MIMVNQKLEKLINGIQKEHSDYFIRATIKDVNRLRRLLCKYNLKKVIDFYKFYQTANIPSIEESSCLLDI